MDRWIVNFSSSIRRLRLFNGLNASVFIYCTRAYLWIGLFVWCARVMTIAFTLLSLHKSFHSIPKLSFVYLHQHQHNVSCTARDFCFDFFLCRFARLRMRMARTFHSIAALQMAHPIECDKMHLLKLNRAHRECCDASEKKVWWWEEKDEWKQQKKMWI